MSDGNTSNTAGKPDGPWGRRPDDAAPIFGRTATRILRVLEGQGSLARETHHGVRPPDPDEEERKKKRKKKLRRKPRPIAPGKPRFLVLALLIAVSLILLVLAGMFLIRPEVSLPAPEGILMTRIQMKGLDLAIRQYWARYQRLPEGSPSEIVSILAAGNKDLQNPDRIVFMLLRQPEYRFGRLVKQGDVDEHGNYIDGWGRPMDIQVDPINRRMWIRSYGPDGVDERGGGDDIDMQIVPDI